MPPTVDHDRHLHQKPLPLKKENKFSRLVSKEDNSNSSFRVYYEGPGGAIPFTWESTPGTPKHSLFSDNSLPPLTPPPSYQSKNIIIMNKTMQKQTSKNRLLRSIFPRLSPKNVSPLYSSSSSSISSSFSSSSYNSSSSTPRSVTSRKNNYFRRRWSALSSSRPRSPLHFEEDEEAQTRNFGSPNSTLCLGLRRENNSQRFRGCFQW